MKRGWRGGYQKISREKKILARKPEKDFSEGERIKKKGVNRCPGRTIRPRKRKIEKMRQ